MTALSFSMSFDDDDGGGGDRGGDKQLLVCTVFRRPGCFGGSEGGLTTAFSFTTVRDGSSAAVLRTISLLESDLELLRELPALNCPGPGELLSFIALPESELLERGGKT